MSPDKFKGYQLAEITKELKSRGSWFTDVRAKFSNSDFFLRLLPLKADELVMSEM